MARRRRVTVPQQVVCSDVMHRRGTSNFRLRVSGGCSMFNVPLWKLPFREFLLWQIQQN